MGIEQIFSRYFKAFGRPRATKGFSLSENLVTLGVISLVAVTGVVAMTTMNTNKNGLAKLRTTHELIQATASHENIKGSIHQPADMFRQLASSLTDRGDYVEMKLRNGTTIHVAKSWSPGGYTVVMAYADGQQACIAVDEDSAQTASQDCSNPNSPNPSDQTLNADSNFANQVNNANQLASAGSDTGSTQEEDIATDGSTNPDLGGGSGSSQTNDPSTADEGTGTLSSMNQATITVNLQGLFSGQKGTVVIDDTDANTPQMTLSDLDNGSVSQHVEAGSVNDNYTYTVTITPQVNVPNLPAGQVNNSTLGRTVITLPNLETGETYAITANVIQERPIAFKVNLPTAQTAQGLQYEVHRASSANGPFTIMPEKSGQTSSGQNTNVNLSLVNNMFYKFVVRPGVQLAGVAESQPFQVTDGGALIGSSTVPVVPINANLPPLTVRVTQSGTVAINSDVTVHINGPGMSSSAQVTTVNGIRQVTVHVLGGQTYTAEAMADGYIGLPSSQLVNGPSGSTLNLTLNVSLTGMYHRITHAQVGGLAKDIFDPRTGWFRRGTFGSDLSLAASQLGNSALAHGTYLLGQGISTFRTNSSIAGFGNIYIDFKDPNWWTNSSFQKLSGQSNMELALYDAYGNRVTSPVLRTETVNIDGIVYTYRFPAQNYTFVVKNTQTGQSVAMTWDEACISPIKVNLAGGHARLNSDDRFLFDIDGRRKATVPYIRTTGGLNQNEAWLMLDRAGNGLVSKDGIVDGEDVFGDHMRTYKSGYEDLATTFKSHLKKDERGQRYIPLRQMSWVESWWVGTTRALGWNKTMDPSYDLKLLDRNKQVQLASAHMNRIYVDYRNVDESDAKNQNWIGQRGNVYFATGQAAESADQWFRAYARFRELSLQEVKELKAAKKLPASLALMNGTKPAPKTAKSDSKSLLASN